MALNQTALEGLRIVRDKPSTIIRSKKYGAKTLLVAAVSICLAIFAVAWFFLANNAAEVEVVSVDYQKISGFENASVLDASGYVIARRKSTVSAKVTARIVEVLIEEGDYVTSGQLLARLDPSTFSRQLELSKHQLEASQAQTVQVDVRLREAQSALLRTQKLAKNELVSEAEYERATANVADYEAQLQVLRSQIKVAQSNVALQQQNMQDLEVTAPFSGVVISKDAQPGEMVSPTSAGGGFTRTGIATIVDMDSREIEVDVNESFIQRVSENQPTLAILDAYPDWSIPSHVISIVPTADRQKATVKVRIGFEELDKRVLPDMAVKVRFLNAESTVEKVHESPRLALPRSAVFSENNVQYVWRIKQQKLERVAVSTAAAGDSKIYILSGIQAGDRVVKTPTLSLQEGKKVRIKNS